MQKPLINAPNRGICCKLWPNHFGDGEQQIGPPDERTHSNSQQQFSVAYAAVWVESVFGLCFWLRSDVWVLLILLVSRDLYRAQVLNLLGNSRR